MQYSKHYLACQVDNYVFSLSFRLFRVLPMPGKFSLFPPVRTDFPICRSAEPSFFPDFLPQIL